MVPAICHLALRLPVLSVCWFPCSRVYPQSVSMLPRGAKLLPRTAETEGIFLVQCGSPQEGISTAQLQGGQAGLAWSRRASLAAPHAFQSPQGRWQLQLLLPWLWAAGYGLQTTGCRLWATGSRAELGVCTYWQWELSHWGCLTFSACVSCPGLCGRHHQLSTQTSTAHASAYARGCETLRQFVPKGLSPTGH